MTVVPHTVPYGCFLYCINRTEWKLVTLQVCSVFYVNSFCILFTFHKTHLLGEILSCIAANFTFHSGINFIVKHEIHTAFAAVTISLSAFNNFHSGDRCMNVISEYWVVVVLWHICVSKYWLCNQVNRWMPMLALVSMDMMIEVSHAGIWLTTLISSRLRCDNFHFWCFISSFSRCGLYFYRFLHSLITFLNILFKLLPVRAARFMLAFFGCLHPVILT